MELWDEIERHQARREVGIPTLTVMVGKLALARECWSRWSLSIGRSVLETRSSDQDSALTDWRDRLIVEGCLRSHALDRVSARLHISHPRAESLLRELPQEKRWNLLMKAFPSTSDSSIDALFRSILLDVPETWTSFSMQIELVPELVAWLGAAAPTLFVVSDPENEAMDRAAWVGALAEAVPALPICLAVAPDAFSKFRSLAPENHAKALLTECAIVSLDATSPDSAEQPRRRESGFQTDVEPVLRSAAELGADEETLEEVVKIERELALAAQGGGHRQRETARSEAERLFLRMLELCPQTAGLFRLNGKVEIEGWATPQMEIDLLCDSLRIAVELDGFYHFVDKQRYKLDRKKDFLLQRSGFLVIRLHADDILSNLRENLDTLIAAIKHREAE
jgi:very-short-patch-repair endonuclease